MVTTLSYSVSEYMALAETARVTKWLHQVLNELNIPHKSTVVYQHNRGKIDGAGRARACHHFRRKHIDIPYKFIIDIVQDQLLRLQKISTKVMLANILTNRPLPLHSHYLSKIQICC